MNLSEIEIVSDLLYPNGSKFPLPSSYDVTFLLKIKSFNQIKRVMRSLQSSSNSTVPAIKSTYNSAAKELTSKFTIAETQQQYKHFELELTSNGL